MKKNIAVLTAIFIASASNLSYQIILIRIFSVSLWYHFAFMVISISMLGIGASGTILSVFPRLRDMRYLPLYLMMLVISIPASYLAINSIPLEPARLSWDTIQIFYILLYYILLSLPFLSFGLAVSTAFSEMSGQARQIYASDLSGAGIGSILAVFLLSAGDSGQTVMIATSVSALSLFFVGDRRYKLVSLVLLGAIPAALYIQPSFFMQRISPYKPLQIALRFPGAEQIHTFYGPFSRIDFFNSPAVRFAPGLSFRYLYPLPEQTGITVDAGEIHAITNSSRPEQMDFIKFLPSALPYELSSKENVLILEPKGGLAVLTAEFYRSANIWKVDSDPLLIQSIRQYSKAFSTDIYNKNTWAGLGRSWLASNTTKFDIIDVSLLNPLPSGSSGFSEDYRFTVEAFEEYISHLNANGLLSVNLFIIPPPRMEFRLINTVAEAFKRQGIPDIHKNTAAIRSWGTITLIFKKSAITDLDIQNIKQFTQDKRFDLLYYPGITEKESNVYIKMPSSEYFNSFQKLMLSKSRREFTDNYVFDITPVYDENPFFHYYLKFGNISEIYALSGKKWQFFFEEGYLLPAMFVQVMFLGMLLISLPAIKLHKTFRATRDRSVYGHLSYFALLGTGFMFIEISFMQRLILLLEHPASAAAVVIASLLLSSGIGSLLSHRFRRMQGNTIALYISGIILLYSLSLPSAISLLVHLPLTLKIIAVFFLIMPAGMLMGIPFPSGIAALGRTQPHLIPWAWAVNGCFSVLAPILAIMFALTAGFKAVMFSGALMYAMAYFALKQIR